MCHNAPRSTRSAIRLAHGYGHRYFGKVDNDIWRGTKPSAHDKAEDIDGSATTAWRRAAPYGEHGL